MLRKQRSLDMGFTRKKKLKTTQSFGMKELIFNQIGTEGGGVRYERYQKLNFEYMKFKCLLYTQV